MQTMKKVKQNDVVNGKYVHVTLLTFIFCYPYYLGLCLKSQERKELS